MTGRANTDDVITKWSYDSVGRVKNVWKNIGHVRDELLAANSYNELGLLRSKILGNGLDSLVYDYNIRGWLTGINKNYIAGTATNAFGEELGYDD